MKKTANGLIAPEGVYFYYVYCEQIQGDENAVVPYGCVCIGKNDDRVLCRGVSLCSPKDQFSKKEARKKAYARFLRAAGTATSSGKIQDIRWSNKLKTDVIFTHLRRFVDATNIRHRSGYDVIPTEKEMRILASSSEETVVTQSL